MEFGTVSLLPMKLTVITDSRQKCVRVRNLNATASVSLSPGNVTVTETVRTIAMRPTARVGLPVDPIGSSAAMALVVYLADGFATAKRNVVTDPMKSDALRRSVPGVISNVTMGYVSQVYGGAMALLIARTSLMREIAVMLTPIN